MIDDLVRQIMHVDDGLGHAGRGKLVQHVVKQRSARHPDQGLRQMVGQWPHAQAEAGRENHGFAGIDGHFGSFSDR